MILGAEPKNQVIWTIHCKVMAPNLQICPNMGKIDEKRPFLSRPSVNYFKNSLKSFVIMLLTAPGVKLPSYRKNGFKASWWRCAVLVPPLRPLPPHLTLKDGCKLGHDLTMVTPSSPKVRVQPGELAFGVLVLLPRTHHLPLHQHFHHLPSPLFPHLSTALTSPRLLPRIFLNLI